MTGAGFKTLLLAVFATAAAVVVAPAFAGTELALSEAGGARFPDRGYVLTLPSGMYLDASRVEVRENGNRVSQVSIVPAGEAEAGQFAIVLVIDASLSMQGRPIEDAVAAARALAGRRTQTQQLAIVAFNSESKVVLPFTTDEKAIEAALASPPALARGTHIYDAVSTGIGLLESANVAAGSIIVLSDGSDTGSAAHAEDVSARAGAAHVRVFSVGLRSRSFKPEPLRALAERAGGEYSEATSSGDLERIFAALGAKLASEYLLRYRSQAPPHTEVHVSVVVEGVEGFAGTEYMTPALPDEPGAPFHRSAAERFLRSPAGMVSVAAFAAFFVALAVAALVRPRARTLQRRMAEFVTLALPEAEAERVRQHELMLARAEKSFERTRWWARFKQDLELADIQTPAAYIVAGGVVGTLVAVWILYLIGGLLVAWIGLTVPFVIRAVIGRKLERKRRKFADQLPDNLQVLSSAMRAGHSLVGALSVVVEDCPEPSRAEFRRVIADEQLGVPLDEAFNVVAGRMASRELEQVGLVAALQRETGGNTAEVLDRVAETIRGRFELRRLVNTLTAQGRMSRWVVSLLPVGLLILITSISPAYMRPLYVNPVGRVLLVVAAVMIVAGSLVIRRIVDIKV
jgi:tight adherence protein B